MSPTIHTSAHNKPGRPRSLDVLIPYPIPERDRQRLIEAGKLAVLARQHDNQRLIVFRHARVQEVIETIAARYGILIEEDNE